MTEGRRFNAGDLVQIVDQFQDSGDRYLVFAIVEANGDRCIIQPVGTELPIPGQQCVKTEMIQPLTAGHLAACLVAARAGG